MKVSRKEAISIFKELGYKTARRWDADLIVRKLNKLPSLIEGTSDLPKEIQDNANHMCNMICRAITYEGETIELYEEGDAEMAKKKTKKTKTKKHFNSVAEYEGREAPKKSKNKDKTKKTKDKTKKIKTKDKTKTTKIKKEKAGVNKFGYRIGTKSDIVDSVLSNKKHKDVAKIAELTGMTKAFVRMHLDHAVDNNRGVKFVDGKGYISTL